MADIEDKLLPIFKTALLDALGAEELVIEAAKELVKDEIKQHLREVLKAHPEIATEFRDAIRLYLEARMKQAYANIKLAKTGAKLGLEVIPDDLRENLTREFMRVFEKDIMALLERSL